MRKNIFLILLLLPIMSVAKQDLMAQIQEMTKCMQSIDQKEIKALEHKSDKFSDKIKLLCESGKKSEAQEKAIQFRKEMMQSNALKVMRQCIEKAPDSIKGMIPKMDFDEIVDDYSKKSVCDQMK
jgi:mannitol-specific phosphotransferase system IIBC component